MFSDAIILEIQRLLQEGELSRRAIAARLGVGRATVDSVANGRRGLRNPRPLIERHAKQATRCRGCGGLVYKPCRLCRARTYQRITSEIRRLSESSRPDGPSPRQAA
jgi:hypothetical protein